MWLRRAIPEAGTEVHPHADHKEKGRNASHSTRKRDVCLGRHSTPHLKLTDSCSHQNIASQIALSQ